MTAHRRTDVTAAIDELRAIRSSDPCAAIAMTTIKATIHTLDRHWREAGSVGPDTIGDPQ